MLPSIRDECFSIKFGYLDSVCIHCSFHKKNDTESRSTIMPKLSSWIVVLISTSPVNACSCNHGDIQCYSYSLRLQFELFSNWS